MTEIAKVAAEAAAERIGANVREGVSKQLTDFRAEIRRDHEEHRKVLLDAVRQEMQRYHGEMPAEQHIVDHHRLRAAIDRFDNVSRSFWNQIGSHLGSIVVILTVVLIFGMGAAKLLGLL